MAIVAAPGVAFSLLGLCWLLDLNLGEKTIGRITAVAYLASTIMVAMLFLNMRELGETAVAVSPGTWFEIHEYSFPLTLLADWLSIPLMMLTAILTGLIGSFSRRYLHRESGYRRFFLLLNLFGFGSLLIFAAGSFDLLIGGWELVGITSVLLISFFQERREPVRNAVRVFAIYRAGDIGLLVGVFLLHHFSTSASFAHLFIGQWPIQQIGPLTAAQALTVGLLFLVAAAAKAAQFPFSGWLPRAMEGPTPSSAIFYGAISVHAGAYLLLRSSPILEAVPFASAAVIVVGAVTAVVGTLAGRASADAKTALAHGALAQLGLIFIEIGFGLHWLALLHILGHAAVRTLEFLRAPSTLYDYHRIHAAAGGELEPAGLYYEAALPAGFRIWLYRYALERGHVDTILDRFVVKPLHVLACGLASLERRVLHEPEAVEARPSIPFGAVTEKIGGNRG
ncbi:MAG: proton-conducting transporter membrane subunit [Bryobacterales bacterium]